MGLHCPLLITSLILNSVRAINLREGRREGGREGRRSEGGREGGTEVHVQINSKLQYSMKVSTIKRQ